MEKKRCSNLADKFSKLKKETVKEEIGMILVKSAQSSPNKISENDFNDAVLENAISDIIEAKEQEITNLNNKNAELTASIAKLTSDFSQKISLNSDSAKISEILEIRYKALCDQKIEENKKKYENLYMRARKTLREKEKECFSLEDELKIEKSNFEEYKINQNMRELELKKEIDRMRNETEQSELKSKIRYENYYKTRLREMEEENKRLISNLNIEKEKNEKIQKENEKTIDEKNITIEDLIKEKKDHEDEKSQIAKVKEVIMQRKETVMAFDKVKSAKTIQDLKQDIEKLKSEKENSEKTLEKEINDLKSEKENLENEIQKLRLKLNELRICSSTNRILDSTDQLWQHASEIDLFNAKIFNKNQKKEINSKIVSKYLFIKAANSINSPYLILGKGGKKVLFKDNETNEKKNFDFEEVFSSSNDFEKKNGKFVNFDFENKCFIIFGPKKSEKKTILLKILQSFTSNLHIFFVKFDQKMNAKIKLAFNQLTSDLELNNNEKTFQKYPEKYHEITYKHDNEKMHNEIDDILLKFNEFLCSNKLKKKTDEKTIIYKIRKVSIELITKNEDYEEKKFLFTCFTNNYCDEIIKKSTKISRSFFDFLTLKNEKMQLFSINHNCFDSNCEQHLILTVLPSFYYYNYNKILLNISQDIKFAQNQKKQNKNIETFNLINSNNCKCNIINDEITYDKYYFLKERNIKLMNNSLRISVLLKDFINNNRNNNKNNKYFMIKRIERIITYLNHINNNNLYNYTHLKLDKNEFNDKKEKNQTCGNKEEEIKIIIRNEDFEQILK